MVTFSRYSFLASCRCLIGLSCSFSSVKSVEVPKNILPRLRLWRSADYSNVPRRDIRGAGSFDKARGPAKSPCTIHMINVHHDGRLQREFVSFNNIINGQLNVLAKANFIGACYLAYDPSAPEMRSIFFYKTLSPMS